MLSEDELADARDLTHSKHHFRRAETYDTCDVCGHDFRDTSMHYKDTDYPRTTSERAHLALLKLPALLSHIDALKAERDGLKRAKATLEHLGYTDCGGEYWKPPIGKAPDFDRIDAARTSALKKAAGVAKNVPQTCTAYVTDSVMRSYEIKYAPASDYEAAILAIAEVK